MKRYPALLIFAAALAAYLSTLHWHGGDDLPNVLLPFAVLRRGTLALDAFVDDWFQGRNAWFLIEIRGRHLSLFPPGSGLLALPVCAYSALSGAPITVGLLRTLSKLSGALITAASVAIFYKAVEKRCSRSWALSLCALYGLGSWSWSVSSQALWQHGPAQLALAAGLWALSAERAALAGFGFCAAAAIRPDDVFFAAAAFAFFAWKRRRSLAAFCAGAAAPAALTAAYWLYYTGALRPPELAFQGPKLGAPDLGALAALLLSPTRGLLIYFPAAIFASRGAWKKRAEVFPPLLLAACVAQLLFFSCYASWVAGNTFGQRYFAVAALALAWLCAPLEREVRKPIWTACLAYSIALHALGAFRPWPGPPDIPSQEARAWDWSLYPFAPGATERPGLH